MHCHGCHQDNFPYKTQNLRKKSMIFDKTKLMDIAIPNWSEKKRIEWKIISAGLNFDAADILWSIR